MLVSVTTVFTDCQTTNAAKQILTRTTKFSGLFDLFGTAGAAYLRQDQDPGTSPLYNSYTAFASPGSDTCLTQSTNLGIFMSNMLNFNTPPEVYYDMLVSSLG